MKRLAALIAGLALSMASLAGPTAPPAAAAADRDCGDFSTQAAAQQFFLNNGGPNSDPHRLDSDGDGIACETNPCPCNFTKSGGGGSDSSSKQPKQIIQWVRVVRVIDGDTVKVRLRKGHGRRIDVRLVGIGTPEIHGTVECGGPAASRTLKKVLPKGKIVKLMSDPSQRLKDRYGRALRYVHRGRTDVNKLMVKRGKAKVYIYANKPFRRVTEYRRVQRAAKAADRGIWGHC